MDEDLPQHIIIVRQGFRRHERGGVAALADHSGAHLTRLDLGMEARAEGAGHSIALLTRLDLGMEAHVAVWGHSGALLHWLDLGVEPGGKRGMELCSGVDACSRQSHLHPDWAFSGEYIEKISYFTPP
jgi:hypothetical protein